MTTRIIISMWLALAFSVNAGEPFVQEKTLPDGLTELRVVSDAGKDLAVYKVDLKTRHEPATNRTGLIKQWESWRYGAFFCFNDNQFNGVELSKNKDAKLFNPSKLDIAGWAKTMKSAGMRYAVLTTRHTSGFLLWDSPTTEFDVGSSPGKADVAGEFVKECRKAGIAPAFYYCLWGGKDWMPHPNARALILAQLNELATRHDEISYFWIDMVQWAPGNLSPQEIYDAIKNAQPNAVVILNQGMQAGQTIPFFPTDVLNGEQVVPLSGGHQPIRTVNGKKYYLPFEFEPVSQGTWFTYETSKPIEPKVLFDLIKRAYDRGSANVLLALAADHTGSMRSGDVRQLEELGRLLREAGLLETPKAAVFPARSLALGKPAKASGVWENNVSQYGAAMAFDGDPATRWAGPGNSRSGWLEVDLGNEVSVSTAVIQEGWDRTRKFSVQYKVGDEWKNAAEGTTIGDELELDFAPVKARVFRLNITESTDVPTIWEFQLFGENSPRTKNAGLKPLFDYPVRDTSVCLGPDGMYYLTGTTGHPTWWHTNEGIRMWKSRDLKTWEPMGLVWSFEKNATWQKGQSDKDGKIEIRAIWAPEVHYFKGTYWLAYCVNYGGTGILKSESGKPEGPYVDVKKDGPLTGEIDSSLFADDDGTIYLVWQNGKIAKMKDDMSGLAEEPRHLKPANADQVGFEAAFITKINGWYHLICADFNNWDGKTSTYDCMAASAENIYGPYGDSYLAIPCGGHNVLFKDVKGEWWSTYFGNDDKAPFKERPAILRVEIGSDNIIKPVMD